MSQLYPFTDPVVALETPPKTIVAGHGCFVTDSKGKTYLDAVAGLWCVALGFDNQLLISAAIAQMQQLPYYHSFMGRTTGTIKELASRLADKLPPGIDHLFFACSGSEAVDTAAKLMCFYQNARNKPDKKKIVARHGAYHGSGYTSAALVFYLPGPFRSYLRRSQRFRIACIAAWRE
jgi:adenosylmethionine-8-amino-7-oxononanoate aminotransferase